MKFANQTSAERIQAIAPFVMSDDETTMVLGDVTAYDALSCFDESMCVNYGYYIEDAETVVNGEKVNGALCVRLNLRGGDTSDNWYKLLFTSIRNYNFTPIYKIGYVSIIDVAPGDAYEEIIEELQRVMFVEKRLAKLELLIVD